MFHGPIYCFLYCMVRFFLFFWHPVLRVQGRENIPQEGRLLICSNHYSMSDPVWIVLAMRAGHIPRIMAKKEARNYPVLGTILEKIGVIFVERGMADVNAIKSGLRCLRDEQQLLIFPEGTRVRRRQDSDPKRGAMTLSARTHTPVLPVYVSEKRRFLGPMEVTFGTPYLPEFDGEKASDRELELATAELMARIYAMGDRE